MQARRRREIITDAPFSTGRGGAGNISASTSKSKILDAILPSPLEASVPVNIDSALALINFVGSEREAERATDVVGCLGRLGPFLKKVEMGETGRGRHLTELHLRGDAQIKAYRIITAYTLKKVSRKGKGLKNAKSKADVGKKLDVLEAQVSGRRGCSFRNVSSREDVFTDEI
jgi:hypothetical protein